MARYNTNYSHASNVYHPYYNQDNYMVRIDKNQDEETQKKERQRIQNWRDKRREVEEDFVLCAELLMT